jgi:hypothetical protein
MTKRVPWYPITIQEWRTTLKLEFALTPAEGEAHYSAGTFPYDGLIAWLTDRFAAEQGYHPNFVPSLTRHVHGLIAWVYGDGEEPRWRDSE